MTHDTDTAYGTRISQPNAFSKANSTVDITWTYLALSRQMAKGSRIRPMMLPLLHLFVDASKARIWRLQAHPCMHSICMMPLAL